MCKINYWFPCVILLLLNYLSIAQEAVMPSIKIQNDTVIFAVKITNNCNQDYYIPSYTYMYGDITYNQDSTVIDVWFNESKFKPKKYIFDNLSDNKQNKPFTDKKHNELHKKIIWLSITNMEYTDRERVNRMPLYYYLTIKKKCVTNLQIHAPIEPEKIVRFTTRNIGLTFYIITKKNKDVLDNVYNSLLYLNIVSTDSVKQPYSGNPRPEPGNSCHFKILRNEDGRFIYDKTMTKKIEENYQHFDGCLSKEIETSKKTRQP